MDKNYTHVSILLDGSGSMAQVWKDHIEGIASLVQAQSMLPGRLTVDAYVFSARKASAPIADTGMWIRLAGPMHPGTIKDYSPAGVTPLYDSVCEAMDKTGEKLSSMLEKDRPGKVLFFIVTDGGENASKKHTLEDVQNRIKVQTGDYNWQIGFLGANIDAWTSAMKLGVAGRSSLQFVPTPDGVASAYVTTNSSTTGYRTGQTESLVMTEEKTG